MLLVCLLGVVVGVMSAGALAQSYVDGDDNQATVTATSAPAEPSNSPSTSTQVGPKTILIAAGAENNVFTPNSTTASVGDTIKLLSAFRAGRALPLGKNIQISLDLNSYNNFNPTGRRRVYCNATSNKPKPGRRLRGRVLGPQPGSHRRDRRSYSSHRAAGSLSNTPVRPERGRLTQDRGAPVGGPVREVNNYGNGGPPLESPGLASLSTFSSCASFGPAPPQYGPSVPSPPPPLMSLGSQYRFSDY
ncbi:hypothetical protein B0T26DRAFT_670420 [Lasiosphaeria miniovina]|uniref:Uncharacterized protein n=1 Tax=Lasiosphaeria miniovina TaxID=1954250 RepID=A0AA40BH13_9PEZI|nr:uncharacterized protein B0T26DRAFT_670420 [Lasiosphaeria miniovina]KAK0734086.1 hypothetical protein B0T26DRAFT_670420 [Lasiosphaeria miniovina]